MKIPYPVNDRVTTAIVNQIEERFPCQFYGRVMTRVIPSWTKEKTWIFDVMVPSLDWFVTSELLETEPGVFEHVCSKGYIWRKDFGKALSGNLEELLVTPLGILTDTKGMNRPELRQAINKTVLASSAHPNVYTPPAQEVSHYEASEDLFWAPLKTNEPGVRDLVFATKGKTEWAGVSAKGFEINCLDSICTTGAISETEPNYGQMVYQREAHIAGSRAASRVFVFNNDAISRYLLRTRFYLKRSDA
jgi:hypothetical protein